MRRPATDTLQVLSAGAAKAVVQALAAPFEGESGVALDATFDAAGAIRDRLLAGVSCDVLILPAAMQDALAAAGQVDAASITRLGRVATGIAVPAGERGPPIADAEQLRSCLSTASALYCPDTERSTAGIHFAGVLRALRIYDDVAPRLRAYANGAEAMAAMAAAAATVAGATGCTQVTEILYTPGIWLVGLLPSPFELATVYSVAVATGSRHVSLAQRFAARLAAPESLELRRASGFS